MRASDIVAGAAIVALLVAVAFIGNWGADAAEDKRAHYCEMVDTWNENQHVPPEQRPGWPPYEGECK